MPSDHLTREKRFFSPTPDHGYLAQCSHLVGLGPISTTMISTIIHTTALLCLLVSAAEAWSSSSLTPLRHHRPNLSPSPLTKDTCNNNNNIHRLTAAPAAVRHTNNSVTPFNQHYRSGKHVIMMSATTTSADSNSNDKTRTSLKSNIQRIGNVYKILQQLKTSLKTVVSNTIMSFTIMFTILVPKMALARSSSDTTTTTTISSATTARGNNGVGIGRKVGKFVVTLGAIGAGVTSANLLRGKFNYCNDEEDCDGKKKEGVQQQQQQQQVGGEGGVGDNGGSVNGNKSTTKKKEEESVVETLSEKMDTATVK